MRLCSWAECRPGCDAVCMCVWSAGLGVMLCACMELSAGLVHGGRGAVIRASDVKTLDRGGDERKLQ